MNDDIRMQRDNDKKEWKELKIQIERAELYNINELEIEVMHQKMKELEKKDRMLIEGKKRRK